MKKIFIFTIIIFAILFSACDISLGSRLYLKGPELTIIGPEPEPPALDPVTNAAVFNLHGTVYSENKITKLTVVLEIYNGYELVKMGRGWQWEGEWQYRESDSAPWRPYTASSYNDDNIPDINPPSWVVNGDTVTWNLPVDFNRMESGEYFITISAYDNLNNHDVNSNKKLKIRYNNKAPTLRIDNPRLLQSSGSSLSNPEPPDYSAYIFDPFGNPEQTYSYLSSFTNDFDKLSWTITPGMEGSPGKDLSLMLANRHDLDNPASRTVYYSWSWDSNNGTLPQRGIHTDGTVGSPYDTYYIAGGRIGGASSPFTSDMLALPQDRITPIQLVSRVTDGANAEYKSLGWYLYLPDSDKPFVNFGFGCKVKDGETPPADAAERNTMYRGTRNSTNYAYDDDGLKSITYTVTRLQASGFEPDTSFAQKIITYNFPSSARRQSWEFFADASYGTGRFKITAVVKDVNGIESDPYHTYITIASNSRPTLKQWDVDTGNPLWGDANGSFTIKGIAQIEDSDATNAPNHGVTVSEVLIVWMKDRTSDNLLRYQQADDPLWNTSLSGGAGQDTYGNKIWQAAVSFGGGDGNNNGNYQEDWNFTKTLNWFTDLNVGNGPGQIQFGDQIFRVRFRSQESGLSSVASLTTRGDQASPSIPSDEIRIVLDGGPYTNQEFRLTDTIPAIATGTKIMLKGTWSDSSITNWSNIANLYESLGRTLKVTWEGEKNKLNETHLPAVSFTKTTANGGAWETGWHAFTEQNTDPIARVTVSLTNLSNNTGITTRDVVITTDNPTLTRISSTVNDGRYSVNKAEYIEIFMDFNRAVSFTDSVISGTPPALRLNNNAIARYERGNGSNRIIFRYYLSEGASTNALNVVEIIEGSYPLHTWRSIQGVPVTFPAGATDPAGQSPTSLAGHKNIVIDKEPLEITYITTTTDNTVPHGVGSQIIINVKFNKPIRVSGAPGNTRLETNITGAFANYDHVAGDDSLNFIYTVRQDDNISQLAILSVTHANEFIKDEAGNLFPASVSAQDLPNTGALNKIIAVKTTPPAAPSIGSVTGNRTYYGDINFTITGIESNTTVEYNLNYSPGIQTGWETAERNSPTDTSITILLNVNGTYNIAARQYDNATTPNYSGVSASVDNVRIDKGALLMGITSLNNDGVYGYGITGKDTIDIQLEFRIPLWLDGNTSPNYLTLNTQGGSNQAQLFSAPATSLTASRFWTFRYTIPAGVTADPLDVTALNLGGLSIKDEAGIVVNPWISLSDIQQTPNNPPSSKSLSGQKNIIIQAGRPTLINNDMGSGIIATTTSSAQTINFTFDRAIDPGNNTTNKFIVRQINDDYRIPAVLTESEFTRLFRGREDIFTDHTDIINSNIWGDASAADKAAEWLSVGEYLYEKGSNGATEASGILTPDTTVKYVLRYEINPNREASGYMAHTTADTVNITYETEPANKTVTMGQIRTMLRAAEALTFSPTDPEVTITGSGANADRVLSINLRQRGGLPVRGAQYEWQLPNGFVKDKNLGMANGGLGTGTESSPNGYALEALQDRNFRFTYTGITNETPVIRVDKSEGTLAFRGTGNNRNVEQKLQTAFKIDSRTPGTTIEYTIKENKDNVGQLIMRNGTGNPTVNNGAQYTNTLPNIGGTNRDRFEDTRMRPQSGVAGRGNNSPITGRNWTGVGLNYYQQITATWPGNINANLPYTIGSTNYNDGGMEINIRARAPANTAAGTSDSAYAYEAAYRSVLVFNYGTLAGNNNGVAIGGGLNRIFIRGGDSTAGDPTTPNFPIARNLSKYRQVKIMTPFNITSISSTTSITHDNILTTAVGNGNYLWFWVTWSINVNAFVDPLVGQAEFDAYNDHVYPSANIRQYYMAYIPSKEHYVVFPGRTTVIESRNVYATQWDGGHGDLTLTNAMIPPTRAD